MNINFQRKFEALVEDLPFSSYWKDKKGRYAKVNRAFLLDSSTVSGIDLNSDLDIIGKNDADIWGNDAASFGINDQKILFHKRNEIFIEKFMSADNHYYYLSCKYPWYANDGKLIGTYGLSILQNPASSAFAYDEKYNELLELIDSFHHIGAPIPLTERQRDCLIYLAKGMTLKEISMELNLSARTVEHYLDVVKEKLNCKNRYELTKKAFELHLL